MPLNWLDVANLSFYTLLLLERVQISWFPAFDPPPAELATALRAYPAVEWFLRHKCPEIGTWLDDLLEKNPTDLPDLRQAEMAILSKLEDLLVYVYDPAVYDAQPFLGWDSRELTALVDFADKAVIDVGAGTGRLTFEARQAKAVFAVEPIANLRDFIRQKARLLGLRNIYAVDGLITALPFPDGFADVTMGGHVFGGEPQKELDEMQRVTRRGGMVILCPGSSATEPQSHDLLVHSGYEWASFHEPGAGMVRKYWRSLA